MLTSIYCPNCRRQIPEDADFCPHCGGPASQRARRQLQDPQVPPQAQGTPVPIPHHPGPRPGRPAPSSWWSMWFLPPPLRGACRYPVLRIYQYICMITGWLILGGSALTFLITLFATMAGSTMAGSTMAGSTMAGSTMADSTMADSANSDSAAVGAAVGAAVSTIGSFMSFVWLAGGVLTFLTLRAFVEMLQVYLDIEDNTRAAARTPIE